MRVVSKTVNIRQGAAAGNPQCDAADLTMGHVVCSMSTRPEEVHCPDVAVLRSGPWHG